MQFFKDNKDGYWIRAAGEFYPVPDPSRIPKDAAIKSLEKPPLDFQALRERAYRRQVPLSRALEAIFEFLESPPRREKLDLLLANRMAIKARHPKPAKSAGDPESQPEAKAESDPEPAFEPATSPDIQ